MNLVTSELTTEEEILLKKYAKLRKMKKSISLRQSKLDSKDETLKRTSELVGIDEQARKLAKLAVMKEENKEKVFKRPVLVRKQEKQKTEYRRFDDVESSLHKPLDSLPHRTDSSGDATAELNLKKKDYINKYLRFQKSSSQDEEQGYTIYVIGNLEYTEENIRRIFGTHGQILNIKLQPKRAFVCFERKESADIAIEQLNNTLINKEILKVGIAKRQPIFSPNHNLDEPTASSEMWSIQAASTQQKSNYEDKRDITTYTENLFD